MLISGFRWVLRAVQRCRLVMCSNSCVVQYVKVVTPIRIFKLELVLSSLEECNLLYTQSCLLGP